MRTVYPLGTSIYDPERCLNGYTLVHSADIRLVDMNGRTVHSWDVNSGRSPKLTDNGTIVFCEVMTPIAPLGGGEISMADPGNIAGTSDSEEQWRQGNAREYDWAGDLVWEHRVEGRSRAGSVAQRLPNGNTLFMYKEPLREEHIARFSGPRENWSGADYILADCLLEVTSDGAVVWSWKSYDHLDLDRYLEIDPIPNWTHFNSLQSLPENKWFDAGDQRFRPGNILLSPRTLGFIFIVDRLSGEIVWEYEGDYNGGLAGQHEPLMIEKGFPGEGNILVLDNGIPPLRNVRHAGVSYVLEIDPATGDIVWKYENGAQFFTPWTGGVTRLRNGNTLIAEAWAMRAFEVTADGEIVWEYVQVDGGRTHGAYRYPYDYCPQLDGLSRPTETAVVPPDHVTTHPVPPAPMGTRPSAATAIV